MTGLLFSEDIQLDIPSHWRTTSQLVLEEGGGLGGWGQAGDAPLRQLGRQRQPGAWSQRVTDPGKQGEKLRRRWFQNSKVTFRGKRGPDRSTS